MSASANPSVFGQAVPVPASPFTAFHPRDFANMGRSGVLLYDPAAGSSYTGISNGNGTFTYVYNLLSPGFNILRTGECFGEMAYLGKRAFERSASVIAVNDITVIEITAEALAQATEGCKNAFNGAFLELLLGRPSLVGRAWAEIRKKPP